MKVTLNEAEKRLCLYIARSRNAASREVAPADALRVSQDDPITIDYEGAMGELSLSKILNIYPTEIFDPSVKSSSAGSDRGDLTFNGVCIDVKTTKYANGRLICRTKNPAIDLIILMTGKDGNYEMKGGMWSADMYSRERFGVHSVLQNDRQCYLAEQHELIKPDDLLAQLSRTSFSKANPETSKYDW